MIADNSFKGEKWMKAELSQAKLQSMKGKKIPRAAYLQAVSDCLQMTPDSNSGLKGTGKTGYHDSCKIKYCQMLPSQSHTGNGWNDNQGSLIAILHIVWYCIAFRKLEQIWSHSTLYIFSSAEKKILNTVFWKMRNSKYNQKIKTVSFCWLKEWLIVRKKLTLGNNITLISVLLSSWCDTATETGLLW